MNIAEIPVGADSHTVNEIPTTKPANRLITRTTLCAVKAPRGDAFDPCQIPVPRALLAPLEALLSRKGQGSAAKLLKRASERA